MSSSEYGPGEESSLHEPVVTQEDISSGDASVPDSPAIDSRWDHDKAETIARAIPEANRRWDYASSEIDRIQQKEASPEGQEHRADIISRAKEAVAVAEQKVADGDQFGPSYLKHEQESLDTAINGPSREIKANREGLHKVVDEEADSLSRLYDANPERFSSMPTAEFVQIAKELKGVESLEDGVAFSIENLDKLALSIDQLIIQRQTALSRENQDAVTKELKLFFRTRLNEDTHELEDYDSPSDFFKLYSDMFDKSSHDIWNEAKELVEGFAQRYRTVEQPYLKSRADAFRQEHGIKPPPPKKTEETAE